MTLGHVPTDHIEHLLLAAIKKKKLGEKASDEWRSKLNFKDPANEAAVHKFIEETFPGTTKRLDAAWTFISQRAVHLWKLNFAGKSATVADALVKRPHVARARRSNGSHDLTNVRRTAEGAELQRVFVDDDELVFDVMLWKTHSWTCNGEVRSADRTEDVVVRILFSDEVPLAEVYASQRSARIGLFAVSDWLSGKSTPRNKSAKQAEFIEPVTFNERQIVGFASAIGLEEANWARGDHVKGDVGMHTIEGRKRGTKRRPLDTRIDWVRAQLSSGKNEARRYSYPFEHSDGYKEAPDIGFHFKGAPHVTFHSRTSRTAIDSLIAELRAHLGV